jgi:hypothetical protein
MHNPASPHFQLLLFKVQIPQNNIPAAAIRNGKRAKMVIIYSSNPSP